MLHKSYSVRSKKDIARVAKKGRAAFSYALGIKTLKTGGTNPPRFVIVIANKITKKATLRNKLRRQIRAALYKHIKEILQGFDIMIIGKRNLTELDYKGIEKEVLYVLQKARLLQKNK